jgi:hypothetical protein
MGTDEKPKASESEATERVTASEIADNLEAEAESHDESRSVGDRSQRQDLTQGMDTGTHDSVHRGVNWKPEFSIHERPKPAAAPDEPKDKKE